MENNKQKIIGNNLKGLFFSYFFFFFCKDYTSTPEVSKWSRGIDRMSLRTARLPQNSNCSTFANPFARIAMMLP
jgi:hypothetical protein